MPLNDLGDQVRADRMMMTMRCWFVMVSCLSLSLLAGCSKKQATAPAATDGGAPLGSVKVDAGPPPIVGAEDPFARLTAEAAKSLKAGYKAQQAKKYDEARAAFAAVVAAAPDYAPGRMQEIRAAILGGHASDVPDLWRELLARDFVAYVGRLDKPKDLAPLRAGPEWARIKAIEALVRTAYAADLGKGLFFVARGRDLAIKTDRDGAAKVELNQELYQVDQELKRYRRLTETEGRVFAYTVAPGRKAIAYLAVASVAGPTSPAPEFADPAVGAIDLATLETVGPIPLGPPGTRAGTIVMGWSSQGEPVWTTRGAAGSETHFALDATRTAVVTVAVSGAVAAGRTTVTPYSVSAASERAEIADQVSLSEDQKSLQIADENRTLRATRALDPDTVRWAPAGKLLAYAGALDECRSGRKPEKNELYVWERGKKAAARVATAPSAFRLVWLDDDRLVYQSGLGKQSRIHVLAVATKTDAVLKPRAGAALAGFAGVICPGAAPENEDGAENELDPEGDYSD
jgi:hypothetical protein